jgi:hypothetical protein
MTGPIGPTGATGPKINITGYSSTTLTLSALTTGDAITFTVSPSSLEYAVGHHIRFYSTGTSTDHVEGTIFYYSQDTLSINAENIVGNGTYSGWKVSIAGEKGDRGEMGSTGPAGALGQLPANYFVKANNEGMSDVGVLYQSEADDYIGVNNTDPIAHLDVSGTLRSRNINQGAAAMSGHVVIDPDQTSASFGILHHIVPKVEYQELAGDGYISDFELTSSCRSKDWLFIWDANNTRLYTPNEYEVNGKILTFANDSKPPGAFQVRHTIL